jgi:hypothetical protein
MRPRPAARARLRCASPSPPPAPRTPHPAAAAAARSASARLLCCSKGGALRIFSGGDGEPSTSGRSWEVAHSSQRMSSILAMVGSGVPAWAGACRLLPQQPHAWAEPVGAACRLPPGAAHLPGDMCGGSRRGSPTGRRPPAGAAARAAAAMRSVQMPERRRAVHCEGVCPPGGLLLWPAAKQRSARRSATPRQAGNQHTPCCPGCADRARPPPGRRLRPWTRGSSSSRWAARGATCASWTWPRSRSASRPRPTSPTPSAW